MPYPKPLEFDDAETGNLDLTSCLLYASAPTHHVPMRIATMSLEQDSYPVQIFLTPATRDALIDWLLAAREAERACPLCGGPTHCYPNDPVTRYCVARCNCSEACEVPATLRTGDTP